MNRYLPIFAAAMLFTACNSGTKTEEKEKASYEKAKETLAEKETKNPANFIKASCRDRGNLIGQTVIKITLNSKATVAKYKDIEVELSFFSKTGALLQKDVTTIYKTLAPGETITEKEKQYTPKQTDSIGLKILSAKNASPE
jgi:PBP1b-binding outer membrane lipoprotein LpoB